jgi:hypothetical protein
MKPLDFGTDFAEQAVLGLGLRAKYRTTKAESIG